VSAGPLLRPPRLDVDNTGGTSQHRRIRGLESRERHDRHRGHLTGGAIVD
jgi:hypothetical protein